MTKGGRIQSLADLDLISTRSTLHQYQKDYDPHESILSPSEIADVIVVDVGGVGGVIAPVLVSCGLKVVGFEAGPFRTSQDYWSGLGLPVMRITYDMRENEHKLAKWMETKAEEILRAICIEREER